MSDRPEILEAGVSRGTLVFQGFDLPELRGQAEIIGTWVSDGEGHAYFDPADPLIPRIEYYNSAWADDE